MIVIAWQSDIGSLNPVVSEAASDTAIFDNKLLFSLSESDFDCSLKKKPNLVTTWEWSEDGTILKMELRDDVKWADGKPMTAQDVAFTYELVADPIVASPRLNHIEKMKPEGRPKVIDDTHIEWHFTEAYDRDTQFAHASLVPVPKHVLADADRASLRGHEFDNNPLVSGPWKIGKYEPGATIVLEPNENFSGPADMQPKLNRVIFKVIPEYSTRLLELQNGTVDLMEGINVADADMLAENNPNIRLERRGWRFMDYISWNLSNPLFADKQVRKALAHSIDIQSLIGKLLTSKSGESYGKQAVSTLTPELCGVHNQEIKPLAFDPNKAKEMFAAAGWTDTDGDGVIDKDGKPFEFTLKTNTGNKRREEAQIIIQSQLKNVGVKVNLAKDESNVFFASLRKRDYEAALGGWSAALFVDPSTMWRSDAPDNQNEFNFPGYSNPEVDALLDKGLATPIPSEAAPIWREVQAKIYEDQPYMFLYWRDDIVGIDNRFENTQIDILAVTHHLEKWSVPDDKVKYKK